MGRQLANALARAKWMKFRGRIHPRKKLKRKRGGKVKTHRYTYDLQQVSHMLNRRFPVGRQVTVKELVEWAEQSCFPTQQKNGKIRVDGDVIPLIEKTRHYFISEGFNLEQVKEKLKEDITLKTQSVAEKESRQRFQLLDSQVELSILKQIRDENEEKGRTDMMEQLNTEQDGLGGAETRLKRTVIHSEMRMKAIVEKSEKHILENLQQIIRESEAQTFEKERNELQQMIAELEEAIQVFKTDFETLQEKHQEELNALSYDHFTVLEEVRREADERYAELMNAGFFARLHMKKEWRKRQSKTEVFE